MYRWAVGTLPLKDDTFTYEDPHAGESPEHWTYSGTKQLHLEDGRYYVSVQAINNVVFGGALVTTVSHSVPYVVDTVPPVIHSMSAHYDDSTNLLILVYNIR